MGEIHPLADEWLNGRWSEGQRQVLATAEWLYVRFGSHRRFGRRPTPLDFVPHAKELLDVIHRVTKEAP